VRLAWHRRLPALIPTADSLGHGPLILDLLGSSFHRELLDVLMLFVRTTNHVAGTVLDHTPDVV
jgi:hypothetical protein